MNKRLFLHIINNGEEVARKELLSYTYGAKRMGGAPTLTSTLQDLNILDINNRCWAMFADKDGVESGEVYYVKQVPNSTKSNTDARYKYDIEFIHERFVLDNIYLFDVDATLGSGSAEEKVSNKTEFIWSGNLYNYLRKLDAALEYSFKNAPSGYARYRVDFSGANQNDKKEVVISFKDVTFTAALQEIYNKFEVHYYFEGKTIYIGDQISSVVTTPLEYGANDALLSISKQNANHKTVNRCTGVGSSDNLPYYYPNDSATGEHEVTTTNGIVVDSINYDILGLYSDLAQETYLKLSSRYDKDYSTDTTYKSVLNIDLPNRKPYVDGSLKTLDGSEGFKNKIETYAKSRSVEHLSINRPSDVAFGNSFNEDGFIVHDYHDDSFSGGGSSSSTPTIPLGYLHKSVYSTALVTKSVYLAAESKADGLLHVEDISTVFNAYAKESTTISYQCNLKGYDLDSAGESFNVSKITSIYVKIYKGDVLVKTYTPTNLTGTFDVSFTPTSDGHYKAVISITCSIDGNANEGNIYPISSELTIKRVVPSGAREYLLQLGRKNDDGEIVYDEKNYDLTTLGIYLGDSEATEGEIIISEGRNRMPNQKNLMPSIYRDTYGAERFYEATNGEYKVQYTDEWRDDNPQEYVYTFERSDDWDGFANPFEGEVHLRREHVISVEDLKPTIKEASYKGTRIDTLVDVAFDRDDNNDFDENEELKHGYFFVKLPPLGFNLFSMASEQGEMTISMTSGDCNSCSFVIGVGEKTKRNIVEVDGSGNLLRDENGNVKIGEYLEVQNDTTNNSVWLALKKDKSTFGVWMPDSKNHAMPKAGDTYVLLNIRLPKVYIMEAEKRLENEIVKFLKDNNDEKFNFSVKLSRIFFAKEENREVLESLNENSIVSLNYFGKNYSGLYVSSYQVRKIETDVLPEISISLTDSLAPNAAPLQNVVNQVKAEVMASVTNVDFVSQAARTFIRKDKDDATAHKISAQNIEVSDNITSSGPIKTYSNLDVTGYAKLLKGVHTDGDVTIGNYREILGNISGAKISKEGNASFNAIKANVMEIGSLSYNQVRATSAYTMFDDTATIVAIEYVVGGYILTLEGDTKDDNGEFVQPFDEGDIVFGVVNKMNNLSNAQKGECWMNVAEVIGNNKIKTILYSDGQTSDGINLQPTIDMLIAHRGNNHKNSKGEYDKVERQSSFYISSKDGNIVQLLGVTSPLLYKIDEEAPDGSHYSNYGVVLGKPTKDLYNYIKERYPYVKSYDPIMFAKYGIFENFLQLDHRGVPIKTANFRGEWSLDTATNDPYRVTFTTYDTVTHDGSLWECRLDGTTTEPSSTTTNWLLLVAKGKDKPMPNENLLDNTLRFDDNWTLGTSSLYKAEVEDGEDGRKVLHCTGRNMNLPFAKQFITGESVEGGVNKVVADEWYTLSFELKGTSGGVRKVLSAGIVNESEVIYIDGVEQSYTDNMATESTKDWVRHSYTFKTVSAIPADAFVGFTFTGSSDFYLDKIKLERGKEVTPWSTSANDGIGKQGADGVSVEIASTTVRYASHDSGSERPSDDKWSEILPSVADGLYLWTWTQVVYSTGDTTDSYSVSRMGVDGKGIQSAVVTYVQKENTDVQPKDFPESDWGEFPSSLIDGHWLYTRTVTTYSDGSISKSYSVTQNGQGSYYAGLQEYYAPFASPTVAPTGYPQEGTYPKDAEMTITGSWDKVRPSLSDATPYLWNFSVSFDSKGNRYVVAPVCIGNFAKGIKSIVETYAISAYSKPNGSGRFPTDISSWTDEAQDAAPTEEKPYQWNKTETAYNDDSTEQFYHVSAVKGEKGETGKDGRGINSVSMEYAVTTTFEQPSLGSDEWKSERPSTIAEGSYLWMKTIVDYTDDSVADTVGVTVSRIGANGTSVSVKKTEYAESTSATTAPTTGWSTSIPSVDEGNYLWTRTTFSDGKVAYSVAKNGKSLTIVSIKYSSVLNSSSQPAESSFTLTSMPTTKQGDYLWTLTTYSDGTKDYSKSYIPNDGVGINSTTITYGKSTSANVMPTSWQSTIPTVGEDEYLWTRTIIDYTDSSIEDTVSYTYSHQGKTGQAGTSVSVKSIKYQAGDSATTAPTGTWSDNVVEVPQGGYLWTKTEFSDGSTAYGSARQGSDGKDGLTPQPNILHNTNFDVLDDNGKLAYWDNIGSDVNIISNGYLSYNSLRTGTSTGTRARIQLPTMKKGDVFTFSCVARVGGTESVYCGGITINNSSITSRNLVGIYTPMWNSTDFCFKNTSEWTERKFTFEYTGDSELSGALLSLYVWGGWCEYSTIKLEKGEDATPYVKHVDDNKGERGIQGLQGIQGERGEQGIQGETGADGRPSYFHIKYASDNKGTGMNDVGGEYIGTYTDNVAQDSNDPSKYTWVLVKGAQGPKGDQGIKGENGEDGTSSYLHIAYANSSDGSVDFSVSDSNRKYIGQYIDTLVNDSTDYRSYKWSHIEGPQGPQGIQGLQGIQGEKGDQGIKGDNSYFHIKYANDNKGSGMNDVGGEYIGTYTDNIQQDSSDPNKYTWVLVKGAQGEKGDKGIKGDDGANGTSSYLHIAYANSEDGSVGFSVSDSKDKKYIGQYVDSTEDDSTNYRDYKWTHIEGPQGLTPQTNIIRNSNFDLNDGTYLKFWRNYWVDGIVNGTAANDRGGQLPISTYVELNAHEGLNAIKYNVLTPGHLFISNGDAKITIEKGYVYTLSCMAKYTGQSTNSSGGVFGVRLENVKLSSITSVGENKDIYGVGGSSHTEIYFGKVGDIWTKRSYSFSVKDSHEGDSITFRLCGYAWGKDITVYYSQIKLEISDSATPYVKHVDDNKGDKGDKGDQGPQGPEGQQGAKGDTGPAGKAGPMLYPAGTWTAGVTYKKDGDSVPYVYYDANEDDEIDGLYYILKTDEVTSSNSPAEDTTNWRAMQQVEVMYAKFLMANFAKFGGNNGGVFYDRYLFSQKGENRNGREVSYTKDMFDEYGDLTGNFTPAMLLDFLSGEAVFQKLTELYHRYEAGTGLIKMDKYYNIIVTPKVLPFGYPSEQGYCTPLVILPQLNYVNNLMKNGTHVSIFADLGDYYEAADEEEGIWPLSGTNKQMSTFALISADDVTKGLGIDTRGRRTGNWIVADGYRSKFLLLSPGNMLKLRLAINENTSLSGDESYYWIVENRSVDVCKGQLFATPLLDHESWIPTDPLNFNDFYNEANGYNVERIRSVKTLRQDNWRAGDDVNHPYTPVLLSVGEVGYNIDVTDGSNKGYYAGLTEPNIILSTAKYTKASDGTWEGGWYSNCCYRLLNRTESRKYISAEDGGWPTIDEKTMRT